MYLLLFARLGAALVCVPLLYIEVELVGKLAPWFFKIAIYLHDHDLGPLWVEHVAWWLGSFFEMLRQWSVHHFHYWRQKAGLDVPW